MGSVLLRGELRKYAKNSNFENFESALYLTSGSMPLTINNLKLKYLVIVRFLCVYYLSSYKASNSKFMNIFPYCNKIQYFNSIILPTFKSSESWLSNTNFHLDKSLLIPRWGANSQQGFYYQRLTYSWKKQH